MERKMCSQGERAPLSTLRPQRIRVAPGAAWHAVRLTAAAAAACLVCVVLLLADASDRDATAAPAVYEEVPSPGTLLVDSAVDAVLPEPRQNRTLHIAIVIVIEASTPLHDYTIAINSLECYAAVHGYPLLLKNDSEFTNVCQQKDLMFRRHCVIAELLSASPAGSWMLFLDADVMVVNPSRLIEEFIDDEFDITLYDRFYNWEVAAGSYLVRHSEVALAFLRRFADYEGRLPLDAFHGTDNGALHMLLLDMIFPYGTPDARVCHRIWASSRDYDDLFRFEACVRLAIGAYERFPAQRLRILRKGTGWMRDIWLTSSGWSKADFMLHAIKDRMRVERPVALRARAWRALQNYFGGLSKFSFVNPLLDRLNSSACSSGSQMWRRDAAMRLTEGDRFSRLSAFEADVRREQLKVTAEIARYVGYELG